ncbi:MAG: cell division protein FtsX [Bacillota bacterium]|jgi:cell division transport system permease protein|nr:permease-like cell division protein FtsX [Bacillota bacterium]NLU55451.1 ABC transporter permease [Bacillota bacterium]HOA90608.1 permease-like cell division protein FtsX [Bacillota bacterium]HPQ10247.1 permease-like cell division protein FtsX [Bacillota bacterium]HPZ72426.1 permease-like cell division protein FtsX [Bacillota bacterium]
MKAATGLRQIGKGLSNLWRHKGSTVAAFVTVTIALVVLGFFALTWLNVLTLTSSLLNNLEIRAFLVKNQRVNQIETLPGITQFTFITPEMAMKEMTDSYPLYGEYFQGILTDNPLQASYALKAEDSQLIPEIVEKLKAMPEVDEVIYGGQATDTLLNLQRFIGGFGFLLFFILTTAILLVVANTLRLSFAIRKPEILLEKLLGASPLYIVGPFLWEGTVLGFLSSVAALLIILTSYNSFASWAAQAMPYLPFRTLESVRYGLITAGLILGTTMGLIGSIWGVRRYWPKE